MINLHIHTNLSLDGKHEINEIIETANKRDLKLISITDHNTVKSYYDIKTDFNGKIVYGLEADATVDDTTLDFLCYNFDLDKIDEWCSKTYLNREARQEKIFKELASICMDKQIEFDDSIPYNSKEEYAHDAILRMLKKCPKSLNMLKEYNIETSSDFYRNSTTNKDFPLYLNMNFIWPTLQELVNIIHENGGKVFLAHPYKYISLDYETVLKKAEKLIDGIEIFNNNSKEETQFLYDYAKKHNLLISAGTDFHDTQEIMPILKESIVDEIIEEFI